MERRTISILRDIINGEIWVYLKDEETCRRFYEDTEAEGFMFGSIRPTESNIDGIIAVHRDKTLAHVGYIGRMKFHSKASAAGGLTRIDYAGYIAGGQDFYYSE